MKFSLPFNSRRRRGVLVLALGMLLGGAAWAPAQQDNSQQQDQQQFGGGGRGGRGRRFQQQQQDGSQPQDTSQQQDNQQQYGGGRGGRGQRFQQQQQQQDQQNTDNNNNNNQGNYYRQRGGGGFNGGFNNGYNGGGGRGGYRGGGGGYGNLGGDPFRDEYGILTDRNIFMRDRRIRVYQPPPARIPLTPEQANILTGIYMDDGDHHAIVENSNTRNRQTVHIGDTVARGKVTDIQTDKIGFEGQNGNKVWVQVGSDFTGSQVSISERRIEDAMGGNSAGLSMEEQLRLRRRQELSGGMVLVDPSTVQNQAGGGNLDQQEQMVQMQAQQMQEQQAQMQQMQMQQAQMQQQQQAPVDAGASGSNLEEQMRQRRAAALEGGGGGGQ